MSARYVCDRCGHAFESGDARCPRCLRKSSVRAEGERASSSEAARLAAGDHSQSDTARRGTALVVAIGLCALVLALGALAWPTLAQAGLRIPTLAAAAVAVPLWIHAALTTKTWRAFAVRAALGAGLSAWAAACALLAIVSGAPSAVFTGAVGVCLFAGGIVMVLMWLRRGEEPTPQAGKRR